MKYNTKKGFTLIELLVVIAIIAILAAILFPVFARARENARRSSCQSNMKQIGLGLIQYMQDYDEITPFAYHGYDPQTNGSASNQTPGWVWNDMIYPYVKSEEIFNCPSWSPGKGGNDVKPYRYVAPPGDSTGPVVRAWASKYYGSYALNVAYGCFQSGCSSLRDPANSSHDQTDTLVNLAKVAAPAQTVWVNETRGYSDNGQRTDANAISWRKGGTIVPASGVPGSPAGNFRVALGSGSQANSYEVSERHLETTNVLFMDGHVKALKLDALLETHKVTATGNGFGSPTVLDINYLYTASDD